MSINTEPNAYWDKLVLSKCWYFSKLEYPSLFRTEFITEMVTDVSKGKSVSCITFQVNSEVLS